MYIFVSETLLHLEFRYFAGGLGPTDCAVGGQEALQGEGHQGIPLIENVPNHQPDIYVYIYIYVCMYPIYWIIYGIRLHI